MQITWNNALSSATPNCCKRLTKRRLFARSPSGLLEQSALRGGALSARPFSKRRTKRAAVSVAVFSRFAIYANVVRRTEVQFLRMFRRCNSHRYTGDLPCPYPNCAEGTPLDEQREFFGQPTRVVRYRESLPDVDGTERYFW